MKERTYVSTYIWKDDFVTTKISWMLEDQIFLPMVLRSAGTNVSIAGTKDGGRAAI